MRLWLLWSCSHSAALWMIWWPKLFGINSCDHISSESTDKCLVLCSWAWLCARESFPGSASAQEHQHSSWAPAGAPAGFWDFISYLFCIDFSQQIIQTGLSSLQNGLALVFLAKICNPLSDSCCFWGEVTVTVRATECRAVAELCLLLWD